MVTAAGWVGGDRLVLASGQQEAVKWTAMLLMVADHVLIAFGDASSVVVQLARIVTHVGFPLFALLVAYNVARRGVDPLQYVPGLALFGLVTILPHWAFVGVGPVNALWTLLLGVLLIEAGERGVLWFVPAVAVVVLVGPLVAYGAVGALLVFLLWGAFRVRGWAWLAAGVGLVLVNGAAWGAVGLLAWPVAAFSTLLPADVVPRTSRWVWVSVYPVHLAVLAVVVRLMP